MELDWLSSLICDWWVVKLVVMFYRNSSVSYWRVSCYVLLFFSCPLHIYYLWWCCIPHLLLWWLSCIIFCWLSKKLTWIWSVYYVFFVCGIIYWWRSWRSQYWPGGWSILGWSCHRWWNYLPLLWIIYRLTFVWVFIKGYSIHFMVLPYLNCYDTSPLFLSLHMCGIYCS